MSWKNEYAGPSFVLNFNVRNDTDTDEFTIMTVDMLLGVIGGFSALVW
jgi:hypothetical protein